VTTLEATLRRIHRHLVDAKAAFALIGGLAVSIRTEPRFTRDADLVVAVAGDDEAEALIHRLRAEGYQLGTVLEQNAAGRLATVRLCWSNESPHDPIVDLLFASSGIEAEIVRDADMLEVLPELTMPVARAGHLIALKLLSRNDIDRPQDASDLRALLRGATDDELTRARESARLIEARGYNRGRQLGRALETCLSEQSARR
jgi:predicted nucleotidyltransferase